jgi:hypothetical protein
MRRRFRYLTAAVACAVATVVAQPADDDVWRFYKARASFELRAASSDRAPTIIRGALAAAFDDPERAERLLPEAIRSRPASHDADDAYGLLANI